MAILHSFAVTGPAWEWFENFATAVGRRIYGLDIEVMLITR
jgi:hypothetical protein